MQRETFLVYFNSIKVQLERNIAARPASFSRFQFHKGTIRTYSALENDPKYYRFQFHKGTIRT